MVAAMAELRSGHGRLGVCACRGGQRRGTHGREGAEVEVRFPCVRAWDRSIHEGLRVFEYSSAGPLPPKPPSLQLLAGGGAQSACGIPTAVPFSPGLTTRSVLQVAAGGRARGACGV
eukprot:362836-Chlamydomonas_euryale.AAC.23